jgi:hypothetical protein
MKHFLEQWIFIRDIRTRQKKLNIYCSYNDMLKYNLYIVYAGNILYTGIGGVGFSNQKVHFILTQISQKQTDFFHISLPIIS